MVSPHVSAVHQVWITRRLLEEVDRRPFLLVLVSPPPVIWQKNKNSMNDFRRLMFQRSGNLLKFGFEVCVVSEGCRQTTKSGLCVVAVDYSVVLVI